MSPHLILILMLSSCTLLIMLLFAVRKKSKKSSQVPSGSPASSPTSSLADQLASLNLNFENIGPIDSKPNHQADIIELVDRHRFFQGKNLDTFSRLLEQKKWPEIEQLIAEKFEAQGKPNAKKLAQDLKARMDILAA